MASIQCNCSTFIIAKFDLLRSEGFYALLTTSGAKESQNVDSRFCIFMLCRTNLENVDPDPHLFILWIDFFFDGKTGFIGFQ